MNKAFSVQYCQQGNEQFVSIRITYRLETEGNNKHLSCMVTPLAGDSPALWLQARQFEMSAEKQGRSYTMLYNDRNHQSNLDTSLFIEKACEDIMRHEKVVLC